MKYKIFVVGPAKHYSDWIYNHELTDVLEEADIVLFTGGEDVDPSLYECEPHPSTYSNIERDRKEKEIFDSVRPDQLCLGICRGSQFLCVMNGGLLIQDVSNHALYTTHTIINAKSDYDRYEITSTHHQMQYPFNLNRGVDYDILFYAARRSKYYAGNRISNPPCEPEIVLYHVEGKPKCLAIQGHPEMMTNPDTPTIPMLNQLISQYVR